MPIPRVTEAQVRAAAVELNQSPDDAVRAIVQGEWARHLWEVIASSVEASHPAVSAIQDTVLRSDSSHALVAETERDGDRAKVRIHYGMSEWCYIFARTVTPFLVGPSGGHGQENQDLEHVAQLMAYPLSWLTSRAKHPREHMREPLSKIQESYAERLGSAAELFVLAHEMSHVAAGEVEPESDALVSRMRELLADAWAVQRLIILERRSRQWQLGLTLPGVAVFLCAEALRESYAEIVSSQSHPTARDRLHAIRHALAAAGSGEDLRMMEGVIWVFDKVLPHLAATAPGALASTQDLRDMKRELGSVAADITDQATMTRRDLYTFQVVESLRQLALGQRPITGSEVASLQALTNRAPSVVIEALARAYEGSLVPTDDPDADAVHALGQQLVSQFNDPFLKEAIITG